eukprot:1717305-Rhodomonas_salina.2
MLRRHSSLCGSAHHICVDIAPCLRGGGYREAHGQDSARLLTRSVIGQASSAKRHRPSVIGAHMAALL